ncbi:hypothetical protein D9M72_403750 [compost metagenome]
MVAEDQPLSRDPAQHQTNRARIVFSALHKTRRVLEHRLADRTVVTFENMILDVNMVEGFAESNTDDCMARLVYREAVQFRPRQHHPRGKRLINVCFVDGPAFLARDPTGIPRQLFDLGARPADSGGSESLQGSQIAIWPHVASQDRDPAFRIGSPNFNFFFQPTRAHKCPVDVRSVIGGGYDNYTLSPAGGIEPLKQPVDRLPLIFSVVGQCRLLSRVE